MNTIIKQLDSKIKQVLNLKSIFTNHVSSTVYGYTELKQFVQKDIRAYVKSELLQYQHYHQHIINRIVQQMMGQICKVKEQRNNYQDQCFELKQQVQRQQKVIALMKQQVEDLMVLLNTQRIFPQKEEDFQEQLKGDLRQSNPGFQSGPLQIIQQQQTQRTIMSSMRSCQSEERTTNFIKIQQKQILDQQQIQILSEEELSEEQPRLPTDPNPHLQSVFIPEECSNNTQMNIESQYGENHDYYESELEQQNSSYYSGVVKTEERSLKDISEKYVNKGESDRRFVKKEAERKEEEYQPKTKQFLQQFRKTFNKCLNSMHVSKKHSNKTNSKHAVNSMQVTFGKNNSSAVSNKSSNYTSVKSKNSNESNQKVESMLKNLDNTNKFTIGNKKIELKYEGQKKNGYRNGSGVLYYSNGLCYEGEFKDGYRNGYGILKFNHIQIYNGDWVNDEIQGHGKIRNCAIINKRKSINTSSLSKWISYSGEFKGSKFEGEGTLYLQGGQKFVGVFIAGNANGQGTIYRKNGELESGIWKNNILMDQF